MARPLLLDANLAVLFIVGQTNRSYIAKHKRLAAFDEVDYDEVVKLVGLADHVVFCPNVLTETSNLLRHVAEPIRGEISRVMSRIIGDNRESYVESALASSHDGYQRLGLTDAVLLILAEQGAVLLTTDLSLYHAAATARFEAINFNHLRDARLAGA